MGHREILEQRRLSFGAAADLYDAARPTYPPQAATWMLGGAPRQVADLGAGTGIFTRVLVALGHDVIAVEPDEGMRRKLGARTPGVEVLAGSAEAIPLPSESVDAVTAAQADHWFDSAAAHAEIARVLRPGGVFAPVWNLRDESVGWVAELSQIVGPEDANGAASRAHSDIDFGPEFGRVEQAEFRHGVKHTAASLLALIQSRSYYLTADVVTQREIAGAVEALTDRLPDRFELPYITRARRVRRN